MTHTPGSGIYDIFLKNPAASYQNCVQTASLAFSPGQISVEGVGGGPSGEIQVQPYDASGQSADGTFQFIMSCA